MQKIEFCLENKKKEDDEDVVMRTVLVAIVIPMFPLRISWGIMP